VKSYFRSAISWRAAVSALSLEPRRCLTVL